MQGWGPIRKSCLVNLFFEPSWVKFLFSKNAIFVSYRHIEYYRIFSIHFLRFSFPIGTRLPVSYILMLYNYILDEKFPSFLLTWLLASACC